MTIAVGLDVDGVIADFSGYTIKRLGLDPAKNTSWDFTEAYGEEVNRQVSELCNDPATWVSLPPLEGAKQAVYTLRSAGLVPMFITSMPERFRGLREWWMEKHFRKALGNNPLRLYISHGADKPQVACLLGLTHFVEDKRTTANAMAAAGLTSILVPTSYAIDGPLHPGVHVMSLTDFARDVVAGVPTAGSVMAAARVKASAL